MTLSRRIPLIDVARGVAVLGMFGYHLTWDLAHFGFIDQSRPFSPAFRLYSHGVASAFLFLAGVSLVLARRTPFDWPAWTKHIATICLAAALVTIASYFVFPAGLIGFGILHCIAAALIVATPFLFLPAPLALFAAVAIAAAPLLVQSPSFNVPALIWTGLGTVNPSSNDYRPFFPWAAPVLAGVGAMALSREAIMAFLARWQPAARAWRLLAWGGRHSLAIYLLHQPLFFGALAGLAAVSPPGGPDGVFLRPCQAQCAGSGAPAQICQAACACAAREVHALNLRTVCSPMRSTRPKRRSFRTSRSNACASRYCDEDQRVISRNARYCGDSIRSGRTSLSNSPESMPAILRASSRRLVPFAWAALAISAALS